MFLSKTETRLLTAAIYIGFVVMGLVAIGLVFGSMYVICLGLQAALF